MTTENKEPIHFLKDDLLIAIDVSDCEEGLLLNDICIMQDRTSELRDFIIVKIQRNDKLKQLEKRRFALHRRHGQE